MTDAAEEVVVDEVVEPTGRDFDKEARAQGWKPEEEYKGANWVDAKTFVERGDKYVGILKSKYDALDRRFNEQAQTLETVKSFMSKQEQIHKRQLDDLVKQLEVQRARAVTAGDGDTFDRVDKELAAAKETQKTLSTPVTPPPANTPPTWAKDWADANPWYGKDKAATAVAESYAKDLQIAQPELLNTPEFLEKVAEHVKAELPNKFENKKKKEPSDVEVEGGTPVTSAPSGSKTYNSMPTEAKKEFNRFVKEGIFKATDEDRRRYADLYFE